jgi:hypothetical protein
VASFTLFYDASLMTNINQSSIDDHDMFTIEAAGLA